MKIQVIGAGFVGQATGQGFLSHGHAVTFVDIDENKIIALRQAAFSAVTPTELAATPEDADVTILTINTPTRNGKIDLTPIKRAAASLGDRLAANQGYHLVVVRSTVLPGTSEQLAKIIAEHSGKRLGSDFGLCMNPEFLREKTATEDFANPWIIVIGQYDERSGDILANLYQDFGCPIHRLPLREAEMQKYIHNLYNAVKITFFNEMREIARAAGLNAEAVFPLVAKSAEGMWAPEYGIRDFGPFDGSCLPKDTQAFLAWAEANGWQTPVLAATIKFNEQLQAALNAAPQPQSPQPEAAKVATPANAVAI